MTSKNYRALSFTTLSLLAALAAAGLLALAFVAQYAFGLHPCELCLLQRYPYAAVVPLGLAGWRWPRFWLVMACGALFAVDGGMALYHVGVEQGLFHTTCSGSDAAGDSLEVMRAAILNAPLVACNQAMVHVLGLSMAAWNAVAAFLLAAGIGAAAFRTRRQGVRA